MSTIRQIVEEKNARIRAAASLESHDGVPVAASADFWPVKYLTKYSMQEAFYSIDVAAESYKKAFSQWNDWDAFSTLLYSLGPMLDATGSRRYHIPGRDIPPHAEFQHPDLTLMDAEEYSKLIDEPMKFQIEEILPRLCSRIGSNDFSIRTKALSKAALFFGQWIGKARSYEALWLNEYGIPPLYQGTAIYVPMDWIADKLRGFQQGLLDIKQRPEVVQAACEALVPFILNVALSTALAGGDYPFLFNPQHVSPFISPKDYDKVYWPTFKKLIDEFVKRGYRIWVLFENNQEQHLERLQDLPKGKIVANFEATDLAKAKKALGGKICIAGGMPSTLLARGTPEKVKEQTRSVLKLFEDEPGFIMSSTTSIPTTTKPENIRAWLDAVKEYGRIGDKISVPERKEKSCEISYRSEILHKKDVITSWETIRPEFPKIEGDETIIKESWEQLEKFVIPFIFWLIR